MNDFIELRFNLNPFHPWADVLSQDLADIGYDSFVQDEPHLMAYIREDKFNEIDVQRQLDSYKGIFKSSFIFSSIPTRNWNSEWEAGFKPVKISGRICIRAPFHPADPNMEFDIILSPKMAFGTGHHATTSLMMAEMLEVNFKGKSVLDVGCGTAILSILAEKLGCISVLAIDNDEWAVSNAAENTVMNHCVRIMVENAEIQNVEEKTFNVILANINRNVITADIDKYAEKLSAGGHLLLSGFQTEDLSIVHSAAEKFNFKSIAVRTENNWVMMHLSKPE